VKKKRLGEVLQERGKISNADLTKAVKDQEGGKLQFLGEMLLERNLVSRKDLVSALEEVAHVPYVECNTVEPESEALKLIPRVLAERLCVLPLRRDNANLVVVMAEPQNVATIDELRFTSGVKISPRLGFRDEIMAAIERAYDTRSIAASASASPGVLEMGQDMVLPDIEFFSTSARQANQDAIQEIQAELKQRRTPAVRLASEIIFGAMQKHASDIHIEPQIGETIVRIRVDGVLRDLTRVARSVQNQLISRLKILSDMDIAERRSPQDGRFLVVIGSRRIDLRVSTLPTQYGEKVVMRLLETSAPLSSMAELGMPAQVEKDFTHLLQLPQGAILVTGPTGSGKTTTLYAALNLLRNSTVNIVSVEDPVEYVLAGINQVHVNVRAGLTFATALRSILRQDPNIIMIGEIRDIETAEIAMKAAQTGHLVLSTLHTNDSISAVVRLLDLGVPGYLIASSVVGILAQRLVRKLCSCRNSVPVTTELALRLGEVGLFDPPEFVSEPVGCKECDKTGFRGRVGIYELLLLTDSSRHLIRSGGSTEMVRDVARSNGMRLMQEDALDKIKSGITTLDEVLRVVPFESTAALECARCGKRMVTGFQFCPHCGAEHAVKVVPLRAAQAETDHEGVLHI
jgi:type IV pilus assembly protein PilB